MDRKRHGRQKGSQKLVHIYQKARRHITEDSRLCSYRCDITFHVITVHLSMSWPLRFIEYDHRTVIQQIRTLLHEDRSRQNGSYQLT